MNLRRWLMPGIGIKRWLGVWQIAILAATALAFSSGFALGFRILRPEMLGAVRMLRGQVQLGCITNNVARDDSRPSAITNLDELFDVVVESAKVGMRKPDPRIYTHTCDLLGVAPEHCVFLDDFGVNLKAARVLGMTTIKVDETLSGLDELERVLGLTLRAPR